MTATPAAVDAGGQVTYTITATNNGRAPARNVTLADHLPAALTLVSCSATGGAACAATFPGLPPGLSESIVVTASLSCAAANGTAITRRGDCQRGHGRTPTAPTTSPRPTSPRRSSSRASRG